MNEHTCPVCGYDALEFPPRDYSICACCGTEFGFDDRVLTHDQLRNIWTADGFPWFDPGEPKPAGWNARAQLERAGLIPRSAQVARRTFTIFVPARLLGSASVSVARYIAAKPSDEDEHIGNVPNSVVIGELVGASR